MMKITLPTEETMFSTRRGIRSPSQPLYRSKSMNESVACIQHLDALPWRPTFGSATSSTIFMMSL